MLEFWIKPEKVVLYFHEIWFSEMIFPDKEL